MIPVSAMEENTPILGVALLNIREVFYEE